MGIFSDSSTQDLTTSANWSSSNGGGGTIGANSGVAAAAGSGTTKISATFNAVTGSTSFTVIALISIAITPSNPSVVFGSKLQLTATGTYSDGSTPDITATAVWSSTSAGVATVNATGLVTSVHEGTTTIHATQNGVTGSTQLSVAGSAVSIVLTTDNQSLRMQAQPGTSFTTPNGGNNSGSLNTAQTY